MSIPAKSYHLNPFLKNDRLRQLLKKKSELDDVKLKSSLDSKIRSHNESIMKLSVPQRVDGPQESRSLEAAMATRSPSPIDRLSPDYVKIVHYLESELHRQEVINFVYRWIDNGEAIKVSVLVKDMNLYPSLREYLASQSMAKYDLNDQSNLDGLEGRLVRFLSEYHFFTFDAASSTIKQTVNGKFSKEDCEKELKLLKDSLIARIVHVIISNTPGGQKTTEILGYLKPKFDYIMYQTEGGLEEALKRTQAFDIKNGLITVKAVPQVTVNEVAPETPKKFRIPKKLVKTPSPSPTCSTGISMTCTSPTSSATSTPSKTIRKAFSQRRTFCELSMDDPSPHGTRCICSTITAEDILARCELDEYELINLSVLHTECVLLPLINFIRQHTMSKTSCHAQTEISFDPNEILMIDDDVSLS